MSEYVQPYVVGIKIGKRVAGEIYRGPDAEEKSRQAYNDLRSKGVDCFRAQIREEHAEG